MSGAPSTPPPGSGRRDWYPPGGISESIAVKWMLRFGRWPSYYPPAGGVPMHVQEAVAEGRRAVENGADAVDWVNAWAERERGWRDASERIGRMAEGRRFGGG